MTPERLISLLLFIQGVGVVTAMFSGVVVCSVALLMMNKEPKNK